ncbi:hypothetical protein [Streptomyces nigrescens]|uniref:hypothetical protein n=1 Tax=Streptomyces nigrescens TaxID=1920 RepID=UPI0036F7F11A
MATEVADRVMVFLQWDRHGHQVSRMEFPVGSSLGLVAGWRERVAARGGFTVEAGLPAEVE